MRLVSAAVLLAAIASPLTAQSTSTPTISLAPNGALLSLTAEGQSRRTPDLALFSAGVVTQAGTAAQAIADNGRRMNGVLAALRRTGIVDRDIQTSAINLLPRFSNPELEAQTRARQTGQPYVPPNTSPRIIGYEARNNVQIRVRKLSDMGKVIDTLVAEGANEVSGPSFTLDQQQAAFDEARVEAIAVGRHRAELYAKATGMRVARILSISEGGGSYPVQQTLVFAGSPAPPPPPPPPPPTPVAPGELTLTVSVSMQFELTP